MSDSSVGHDPIAIATSGKSLGSYALFLFIAIISLWAMMRPEVPLPDGMPNCFSARGQSGNLTVGCLSHYRCTILFATLKEQDLGVNGWKEREDFHFCGFQVPGSPHGYLSGFKIGWFDGAIVWQMPYLVHVAIWLVVVIQTHHGFRFAIADFFLATTTMVVVYGLVVSRTVLPLILLVEASTLLVLFTVALNLVFRGPEATNLGWPWIVPLPDADHD